ncbi:MAG: hypothetical protein IKR40_10440 [Treponema sp.]|nr:hypothetical protein [Treponema sp.]
MTYETYNKFATAVKEEMQSLNYEEQLGILTIVVNAMNSKKREPHAMSKDEKLALFEKFKGSMVVGEGFDARKELMESLDKRYGV